MPVEDVVLMCYIVFVILFAIWCFKDKYRG